MACIISTAKGQSLSQEMKNMFPGVRSEIFSSIINYSGTLITDNPLTGQDSSLYSECLNLTNNPELAVLMAASAYTLSFINSYGDWINGENKGLLLNKDGMPKLAYKTIDGVSTNYFQALGLQLNQKLKSIGQYNRYKNLVDTFVNLLTKYNTSEESYYSFIKDYTGSLLEVISTFNSLGIFDSLDPIEVGFVSTNTPYSGLLLTENYNFYKLATSKDSYYKQILETISKEGGIYRNSIIPYNNPRIGDKYLKIIDVNNGIIQIKEGITLLSLENSRSYPSKGIANVLKLKFPEFYLLYATDNIRFGGFMRGIANILLDDYHHKQNTSLNTIVLRAIKFESNLHGGLSSFILNNKISPKIEQLTLFAEVPTRTNTTNSARIQNLILSVEDPTDVNLLLTYIANTDLYFSEIAQHLIGKVKVNIRFEEDNWKVLDPATQQIRETDGSYDPQSNTITLSKNMYGYPPAVLIHELIHAATFISLHNNDIFSKKAELILNEARKLIFQKYNVLSIEELNKVSHFLAYGLSNTDEFFSMLWTNSSFIRELNSVGPKLSLWSKIKNFLLDILGIKLVSKLYVDASTLLDLILSTRNQYTEEELASYREALPIELFDVSPTLFEDPVEIRSITPLITLTLELLKAVSDIYNIYVSDRMNKTHSICRITGLAGTGKTTVCPEIVKTIKEQDNKAVVYVAALTNEAKNNIASKFDKGLKVKDFTIAQLTGKSRTINSAGFESWKIDEAKRAKIEAQAPKVLLLIIDEASMLTTEMMKDLESLYSNATIIYIGDNGQLRPISDSEKNPNTPFMQKDPKDLAYSIEFIQTMRQEEDAPILEVAQQFGNISRNIGIDDESAKIQMREAWAALSKIQTTITERSAVFTINTANKEAIVDQLMPLIFEAIQEGNTNKVGIIPYFNENGTAARTIYNNLIRKKILESKRYINISLNATDDNYVGNIPYQVGEIITLDSPYRNIVDTGQKLVIALEAEPYNLVNPIDGDDPIFTYRYTARYISGNVEKTISMIILPEKSKSKYKDVLDQLRRNAYWEEGLSRELKQIAINQFMGFSMAVANANPSWALNVHKAQGQTYEVIYVPLDDYTYPYNQKWLQSSLPPRLKTAQFSSLIYTAITRASNITILGYGTYRGNNFGIDLLELNSQLNGNKLSQRDIVRTEIELSADKPEVLPQITSSDKFLKYRKLYDFLLFATGSNLAFKDLQSGNKDIADRYIKLFFQREAELVKYNRTFGTVPLINGVYDFKSVILDPRILETTLTEERILELEKLGITFKPLKNVIVKSAQAVVPKQYAETFKLGSHSLAEITPEFFKNTNCFYWSKVKNTDMLVRTHSGNFNIAYEEREEFGEINLNIRKDALGYRIDKDGNRMYQLPQGAIVYTKKGADGKVHDTIVLKPETAYKATEFILRSISDEIVSVQPFLTNIRTLEEAKNLVRLARNYSIFLIESSFEVSGLIIANKAENIEDLRSRLYDYYTKYSGVYRQKLANTLYNSFVKACSITSSRIPTQALASFMDMSVVSYNPYGSNDIFVSRWQLWLQGSDLDIDKSYMLGHSYGKTGLFHHWSPIADYSTPEMVKISDKLPVPNGKLLTLNGEPGKIAVTYEAEGISKLSLLVYNYLHIDPNFSREERQLLALTYIKDILVEFNKLEKFDISANLKEEKYLHNLIYLLNKHNSHIVSDNEAKNLAVDSIISVCLDIRNVLSAHSPIDVATSKLKSFLKELEAGSIGDEYDGISIFQLLEDNQTGKKVVGVMANALKAFLTITQYYNNYYASNPESLGQDNKYFLNKITIEGVDYYMSKLANTTTEEYLLKVLANILRLTIGEAGAKLLDTKDDVSIILSAMVTLATDNAKELALAKLHASLNLASMHTYLLSMGVPFDVVVKYTASSLLFKDLYELTNANSWENKKGTLDKNVWKALSNKAKSGNAGYTQADIELLRNLHLWAQEFRSLTLLLGINSGMKNGVDKALLFKYLFQKIISRLASALKIDRSLNYLLEEDIDLIIKLHGFNPTEELRLTYISRIENLKVKYENQFPELFNKGLGFIEVDIDKYFTDMMYRDAITDIYDLIKSTINVLDIINESPHFYAMLEALNTVLRRVAKGAKGDLLFNKLQGLFDNTQALENNIQVPLFIDSIIIKDVQSFCDDYFVSHFLTNYVTPNYSFRYTSKASNVDIIKSISFDSEEALKDFDYTFRTIIARLKNKFPNNLLLKSLILYERKDEQKVFKLNFNIDMLSKDLAGELQLKYNEIIGGFDEIVDLPISTLLEEYACTSIDPDTNQMRQITVGDLFYLYNLIYNLGQRGQNSLTAILDRYVSSKKDLVVNYLLTVLDFDTLKNEMLVNKQKFNYHIFKRYLRTGSKIRLYNMNPSLQILTNLGLSKKSETLTGMYLRFISALLSGKLKIEMDLNCN